MYHFLPLKRLRRPQSIEKEIIELENIKRNTPLLNHYDTPQPLNHQRKIENVHLNESGYCLDNFLQEEIGFLKKELNNKQNIIDNLIITKWYNHKA